MNWDDLRIALAVQRGGSYAAAAQKLKLDETTVSRRVARLENDLGQKVFQTIDGARVATEAGRAVLKAAIEMHRQSEQLLNRENGRKPIVRRRIASVEAMATHFLAPSVSSLVAEHPHIQVEILLSTDLASFSRWETDLALRLIRPERGQMVIRKLAEFEWVLVQPREDEPVHFCGYTAQHVNEEERKTLLSRLPRALSLVVVNGMSPMKRMLIEGRSIGFLPEFMCGDLWEHPKITLERLGLKRPVWLLIQEHLRDDPDTRILTDWLSDVFAADSRETARPT